MNEYALFGNLTASRTYKDLILTGIHSDKLYCEYAKKISVKFVNELWVFPRKALFFFGGFVTFLKLKILEYVFSKLFRMSVKKNL